MDAPATNTILSRIEQRLAALGKTERGASMEAFGNGAGIRNLRIGTSKSPTVDFFQKLAPVLETSAQYLAFGGEEEAQARPRPAPQPANDTAGLKVIGVVAAGAWRESDDVADLSLFEGRHIPADPRFPLDAQYGLGVSGTSLNRIVGDGGALACVDIRRAGHQPNHGDLVIVQRTRFGGAMYESTAKFYRRNADGEVELWPHSTDPRHQEPVRMSAGGDDETETVTVTGLVTSAVIPLYHDAADR